MSLKREQPRGGGLVRSCMLAGLLANELLFERGVSIWDNMRASCVLIKHQTGSLCIDDDVGGGLRRRQEKCYRAEALQVKLQLSFSRKDIW